MGYVLNFQPENEGREQVIAVMAKYNFVQSRGLSRLPDKGVWSQCQGQGNRPNRFCECAIVGLRTNLHSTLLCEMLI